jgi:phosphatidylglycerol:prolipoprotein diacylglycerol transferase
MHPILFEIGPVTIKSYGAFVALAFFASFSLLCLEARRRNFYPDKIPDMALYMLILGVAGARFLHVLANVGYYKNNLPEVFLIWRGGLAVYGGLFFGIITGSVFAAKKGMPFRKTADLIVPYVALGQSIGRIGCFLNGCCFGRPPYPTQLYASLILLGIFVALKAIENRRPPGGAIFGLYLLSYGLQRFCVDFLRDDIGRYALNLTISQFISVAVFIAGAFAIMG